MERKPRVVIVEDHAIVRKALRELLSSSPDIGVIGEAVDGQDAIRCVEKENPDLVLMDLSMPRMSGAEAIKEMKRLNATMKVLILTMHNTEDNVFMALQAGADGYILKDDSHAELLLAIETVLAGKTYLSPGISKKVVEGYLERRKESALRSPWDNLTHREIQVLKRIGEGYKSKEIADQLCVSVKTVEKHRANIRSKLDLHDTLSIAKYALEKGLVSK